MASNVPFQSFVFNLEDRSNGRVLFQMVQHDEESYELHVEKGEAGQLLCDFTRIVPLKTAESLRDALADLGVFSWEEQYPDSPAQETKKWQLKIVFQEGVFTQESSGGSATPDNFEGLLEELYQLDLPRPGADDAPGISQPTTAPSGLPDLNALFAGAPEGGPDASFFAEMQEAMAQMQAHPELFQEQLKSEFRSMPHDQQESMLDMLASTGFASREWWDKFLRG